MITLINFYYGRNKNIRMEIAINIIVYSLLIVTHRIYNDVSNLYIEIEDCNGVCLSNRELRDS